MNEKLTPKTIVAALDEHDHERVLDLAARRPACLHDERELRGALGPYLAIERCLAAELGVRRDRTHDTN